MLPSHLRAGRGSGATMSLLRRYALGSEGICRKTTLTAKSTAQWRTLSTTRTLRLQGTRPNFYQANYSTIPQPSGTSKWKKAAWMLAGFVPGWYLASKSDSSETTAAPKTTVFIVDDESEAERMSDIEIQQLEAIKTWLTEIYPPEIVDLFTARQLVQFGMIVRKSQEGLQAAINNLETVEGMIASYQPALTLEQANEKLYGKDDEVPRNYSRFYPLWSNEHDVGRVDTMNLPSNTPCEDNNMLVRLNVDDNVDAVFGTGPGEWVPRNVIGMFGIFDGHAGDATSGFLNHLLYRYVLRELGRDNTYDKGGQHIDDALTRAFLKMDDDIMSTALRALQDPSLRHAEVISRLAPALSGSCALFALHDSARCEVKVACVGDSRAVLGRLNDSIPLDSPNAVSERWTAIPLSVDQTGKNPQERARILAAHPDEPKIIDEESGRLLGIAVTRAFGDHRWKWPKEVIEKIGPYYYGPSPCAGSLTPPYMTAEPVITTTPVKKGDFMILASDGLWDNISSEDAVKCVALWIAERKRQGHFGDIPNASEHKEEPKSAPAKAIADTPMGTTWGWKANEEDFVAEDENCAIHLAKNALGGKRREIFCSVMSMGRPASKMARDDITVHVVFFGDDLSN